MNEKEAKERLEDLIDTCNKGIEMHPYDKELFETDREAIETVLQLLDQKDKRIDDLEKALVDEAIKSKVLELYNQRINKLKDKLKKDIKNNKSGINLMDLRCIGKWQEAKEILKILEE